MSDTMRLAELTGAVARAADAGIGFPPETSLRLCLVAVALGRAVGLPDEEVRDVYHTALLRHAGCTASAHEETRLAGDEIELRSTIAMGDAGKPGDTGRKGDEVCVAARIVSLAELAVSYVAVGGVAAARDVVAARAGGHVDPDLAARFASDAPALLADAMAPSAWDRVLEVEPRPVARVGVSHI